MNYLLDNHREILSAIQKRIYSYCRDGSILQYSQEGGRDGEAGGLTALVFRSSHTATPQAHADRTRRLCMHIINYTPY